MGGQGEDSCGKSGTAEGPQERKRRGSSAAARGKRSHARKSAAVSQAAYTNPFIQFTYLQTGVSYLCLNLFFEISFTAYLSKV
ncbi:hypothetical protein [Priestia megaterium]|uniref:hypothetical protein n=1 Tax=Priestia megaterium TaxID=1404 RepID=UPI002E1CD395|nr:hypothetical protein [Priestia megaterium]